MSLINDPNIIAPPISEQPGANPGFGRLKLFDPRSLNYPITDKLRKAPRAIGIRKRKYRGYWRGNQGTSSMCTAYAALHYWDMAPVTHRRTKGKYKGYPYPFIEPHTLYCEAQALDPWEGACDSYDGTSGNAILEALKARGMVTEYHWEYKNVDVVVDTLLRLGPVMIGVDWYEGMMLPNNPRNQYYSQDYTLKAIGSIVGGHETLLCGVDLQSPKRKGRELEVFNSWGTSWGDKGNAYMSLDTLEKLMLADGEISIATEAL